MKFYAYANKGTAEFNWKSSTKVGRDRAAEGAFMYWRGCQPKGSNPVLRDMIGNQVPVTVEVTYE